MIVAGWVLFALLAILWTGGAWIAAAIAGWVADAVASGSAAEAGRELATAPLPEWFGLWADPEWVRAAQDALLRTVEAAQELLPLASTVVGWFVPLVWIAWGMGMAILLLLAVLAHVLLRRHGRRQQGA